VEVNIVVVDDNYYTEEKELEEVVEKIEAMMMPKEKKKEKKKLKLKLNLMKVIQLIRE